MYESIWGSQTSTTAYQEMISVSGQPYHFKWVTLRELISLLLSAQSNIIPSQHPERSIIMSGLCCFLIQILDVLVDVCLNLVWRAKGTSRAQYYHCACIPSVQTSRSVHWTGFSRTVSTFHVHLEKTDAHPTRNGLFTGFCLNQTCLWTWPFFTWFGRLSSYEF